MEQNERLEEILSKMKKFCAYQDRCHQEVRHKLIQLEIYGDQLEQIMAELVAENFLNEERFARSFARGKFNIKKWGRKRIENELRRKQVTPFCIRKALEEEIDELAYSETLQRLVSKKWSFLKEENLFVKRRKVAAFLINKGFEAELVWKAIRSKV